MSPFRAPGYCPVLADGASPPAPPDDGAADPPVPPDGAAAPPVAPEGAAEPPVPLADGAAEPALPPDGEPEDGARVGPYVQPPPVFPWAVHPCVTTAAASVAPRMIVQPVERLRMTGRMSLVARRRAGENASTRDSGLATERHCIRRTHGRQTSSTVRVPAPTFHRIHASCIRGAVTGLRRRG